jgi:hypothetical protein
MGEHGKDGFVLLDKREFNSILVTLEVLFAHIHTDLKTRNDPGIAAS